MRAENVRKLGDRRTQWGSEGPRKIGGGVGSMDRDKRCDRRHKIAGHSRGDKAVRGQAAIITAVFVFVGLLVGVFVFDGGMMDRLIPRPISKHPVSDEITGTKDEGNQKP
jgi:hypothetical protein